MFGSLLATAMAVVSIIGYANNILVVARSDFSSIDGELVVRVIGIPVTPVGAFMGWMP
jgi:hypothetical protein